MFTIKSKYDILKIVNTAKEEKEDPKMKRTHTILATITLISVILTSACTAGSANSNTATSSAPETAVTTTTAPAVTGTVMDRIDEPKAEATTAQTTATTAVTAIKPQETKKAETTSTATTTAKPETTTTVATTKPAPEWTEEKVSATKYVNTDCYSRKKAVLGAETVKLYSVNEKVTVTAKTDTGYYKLDTGAYIHSDYLSDNKVAQTTTITTKKAETPKPAATTTKKQESAPKSIYEYPFDLEAIKQVIVNDAVNNYGLINDDDPSWTPEGSTWNAPLVIWKGVNPNVVRMRVSEEAGASFKVAQMKKGDYFKVYIETIPDLKKDENGNSIEGYAIYFLRGQTADAVYS